MPSLAPRAGAVALWATAAAFADASLRRVARVSISASARTPCALASASSSGDGGIGCRSNTGRAASEEPF